MSFANGVKTEEGKIYDILFAEYSGEDTFDIFITVNGLEEEVVYA
ncbi:unnamed protein product [marine sediment metagenome]|uniref:Uncharacterized protein n=1 Tax=marine sediment metagenome TaxID=412755 RepID=X1M427_9ZZZZ